MTQAAPTRLKPIVTLDIKFFWDHCDKEQLVCERCSNCQKFRFPPRPMCPHCHSTKRELVPLSGKGEVYSWTVVWRPQTPEFTVPYAAVIMRMDEGYDFLSNMIECEPDSIHVGMRAKVAFHKLNDDITLPYFVPVA